MDNIFVLKGLQKNAKTLAVDKFDTLDAHLDDLIKKGEIDEVGKSNTINELFEVGDFAKFSKNIDSVRLKRLEIEEWRRIIESKKGRLKYADESEEVAQIFRENPTYDAMFRGTDVPPTIWLRRGRETDLVLFHETMHFEDFLRRGKDNYLRGAIRKLKTGIIIEAAKRDELIRSYLRERYVLEKILEEQDNWIKKFGKGRWTEEEIQASIEYFVGDY